MNKANKYFKTGLLIFILLTISIFTSLFFEQAGFTALFFVCVIISIILSLGMLLLLLQTKREIEKLNDEVNNLRRIRHHEKASVETNKQTDVDENQRYTEFRIEEKLARILPPEGTHFDNANAYSEKLLQNIAKELDIVQGLFFVFNDADQVFNISSEYAYYSEERPKSFPIGETLPGQAAKNGQLLNLKEIPKGYVTVLSGLGNNAPPHLIIAPVVCGENSIGVIEIASFKPFGENEELLVRRICELMAQRLNELRN